MVDGGEVEGVEQRVANLLALGTAAAATSTFPEKRGIHVKHNLGE